MENQTVAQLRADKFAVFGSLTATERKSSIGTYEYIERMSGVMSIPVSSWKMGLFMKDGKLLSDKREINKVLVSNEKIQVTEEISPELDLAIKAAEKAFAKFQKAQLENLTYEITSSKNSAATHYQRYESNLKTVWDLEQRAQSLRAATPKIVTEQLKDILKNKFWKFSMARDATVRFETANDVTMIVKNPAAGLDITVNFGKYIASLDISQANISVWMHGRNLLTTRGYYHPYISNEGKICWGNAQDTARTLLSSGKFSEALKLLAANLSNYAVDSTPYQCIEDFYALQQAGLLKKKTVRNESTGREQVVCDECDDLRANCECGDWCGTCDSSESDCSCNSCGHCGERTLEGTYCEEHHCPVCGDDSRRPSECCCTRCENSSDDCTCCSICESTNSEDCGCCHTCERTEARCNCDIT